MPRFQADAALQQALPDLAATKHFQHGRSCCKCFLLPVAKAKTYSEKGSIMQACHVWQHAQSAGSCSMAAVAADAPYCH